jgi:hypothetical protein
MRPAAATGSPGTAQPNVSLWGAYISREREREKEKLAMEIYILVWKG